MSQKQPATRDLPVPAIDRALCTGCGLCVHACPSHALALVAGKAVVVHPELCDYTGICERICPAGAVRLYYVILAPDQPTRPEGRETSVRREP